MSNFYNNKNNKTLSKLLEHFIIIIIFFLITLVFFGPRIAYLDTHILGHPDDNMEFVWNIWFLNQAKENNLQFTYSDYVNYPKGKSLLVQTVSWFNSFLSIPLQNIWPPHQVHNLLILFSYMFCAYFSYIMIKKITHNKISAFIGAYIFAFNPWRYMDNMNVISCYFIPLALYFFILYNDKYSLKYIFLSGFFIALSALCSWYHGIGFVIFFLFYSYNLILKNIFPKRRLMIFILSLLFIIIYIPLFYLFIVLITIVSLYKIYMNNFCYSHLFKKLRSIFLILSISFIIVSPLLIPAFEEITTMKKDYLITEYTSANLLKFFIVHPLHPFFDTKTFFSFYDDYLPGFVYPHYIGLFALLVVILNFRKIMKSKYFLYFIFFFLIVLGVKLRIGTFVFDDINLPFQVITHLPLINIGSDSADYLPFLYLFWAIIVSKSLSLLMKKNKKFALIIFMLILMEFAAYDDILLMTKYEMPNAYHELLNYNPIAIMEIPTRSEYDYNNAHIINSSCYRMYRNEKYRNMYQTIHEIPTVNFVFTREYSNVNLPFEKNKSIFYKNNITHLVVLNYCINNSVYNKLYPLIYQDKNYSIYQTYENNNK